MVIILVAVWILIQLPSVQNWLGRWAASYLSEQLGTTVKVGGLQFRLLNKVAIEEVFVLDQQKDTLASIGQLEINTSDWFYLRAPNQLRYIGLKDVMVHAHRRNSPEWNYQFMVDYFANSQQKQKTAKPFVFSIQNIALENIRVVQSDEWKGLTLVGGVKQLDAAIKTFDLVRNDIEIETVFVKGPEYRELRRYGNWSAKDSMAYYAALSAKTNNPPKSSGEVNSTLHLKVNQVRLEDGTLEFLNRPVTASAAGYFDDRDIVISNLTGTISDLLVNGDTLTAKVKDIKAKERSGLEVKHISTQFKLHPTMMEFDNLLLLTNNSRLGPYYAMKYESIDDMGDFINKVRIEARFVNAALQMKDLSYFTSYFDNHPQRLLLNGNALGTVSDFQIRNLSIATGRSVVRGNYSMKGLIDIENTLIAFQSINSQINLEDIKPWAPDFPIYSNRILQKFGTTTFTGDFSGTINKFKTAGSLKTQAGNIVTDFTYNNSKGVDGGFLADIKNAELDAGYLLDIDDLGVVAFEGSAYTSDGSATAPLLLEGLVRSATYKGYGYQNVLLDGKLSGDSLIAGIALDDENLSGDFVLGINLAERSSTYKASGSLNFANFKPLGLTNDSIVYSGVFDVDFKGNTVDDFVGYARLDQSAIFNGRTLLNFDSLVLRASFDTATQERVASVHSDNIDADLKGHFNFSTIHKTFQTYLNRYYPSIIPAPKNADLTESIDFSIRTKEIEPYLRIIDSNLVGFNQSAILGRIDIDQRNLLLNANIPFAGYKTIKVNDFVMGAAGSNDGTLAVLAQLGRFSFTDSLSFPKARVIVNTYQDTTNLKIQTESAGALGDAQIEADIITRPNGLEAVFQESSIIFNSKKWQLGKGGRFEIRDKYLIAERLKLFTQNSELVLQTVPNDEGDWNDLIVDSRNVYLNDFLPYFITEPFIGAALTGRTIIEDPLGKAVVSTNLELIDLIFIDDTIGNATLITKVDPTTGIVTGSLTGNDSLSSLVAKLKIQLPDAVNKGGWLDVDLDVDKQRIKFLDTYLSVVFSEFDGFATGNLKIRGPISTPSFFGKVLMTNATLTPDYTKVRYTIDSTVVEFGDNFVDFGRISIEDSKSRRGEVRGRMYHRFFDSLSFNLGVSTNGMEVLNTAAADNDLFYGKAVARASFDLNGPLEDLRIKISGTPTDSSRIFIKLEDSRETDEADFIVFKEYGRAIEASIDTSNNNISIDIDLSANMLAEINVILDALTNDIIKAQGRGNIKISSSTKGATTMSGRFDIEQGFYNYSFQTLIRKPFQIEGGDNFIEWTGDPYDANMNLEADYTANSVNMRTLLSSDQSRTVLDQSAQNYIGDVLVKIYIKGLLSNPNISFGINFPAGSVLRSNFSANEMLRRIEDDQSELLKQVTYLIVFNSFAPYQQTGGSLQSPGADLAINTVSELLSNEMSKILTNVLGQVFNDRSLNVDISTNFYNSSQLVDGNVVASTNYDRFAVDFKLNKSYLNNRIVVNLGSNFDAGIANTANSGVQFLPDISVEFVLTPNRRLRFIIFKKDNLDFSGRRNRAGMSISWRRDYDRLFGEKAEEILIVENEEESQ